jgi:hypothetical protein
MTTTRNNFTTNIPSQTTSRPKDKTLAAYADWISKHDWDVFGTLTFAPGHKRNIDVSNKHWSSYWNKLDRLVCGQTGNRVERAAFTQFGSLGQNPHIHFLAKSPINTKEFCVYLNALWSAECADAAPPASNHIMPLLDSRRATDYLLHDFSRIGSETFNHKLTYLNSANAKTHICTDAADRLKAATKGIWLVKAQLAFDEHVKSGSAHYNRRHAH